MTRKQVLQDYVVNSLGVISSPGKFEGEMLYMPAMYEAWLDGSASDDDEVVTVDVLAEDHVEFPELGDMQEVKFTIRDDGFVCEC